MSGLSRWRERLTGGGGLLPRLARRLGLRRWWRRRTAARSILPCEDDRRGALLVGHPYGVLGVGEYVRASAAAFAAAGIPFRIRNTYDWGEHLADRHPDFAFWDRLTLDRPYRVNIFHINADEMAEARRHLGDAFFADRYNIAAWHWELSHFPQAWLPALTGIDELWASSRFIRDALLERADVPVTWIPHPVEVSSAPADVDGLRLPGQAFLFLTFFDFTSYLTRKNPIGAVRAFQRAFPRDSAANVCLVVKANGSQARPEAARTFLASPELADPRILLVDEVMDRRQVLALMRRCDCFVSLHRSEGFGRGLAEALLLGKPVVATGYSGNTDFTTTETAAVVDHRLVPVGSEEYPHAAGQVWAEPDLDHAAVLMRRVADDPDWAASLARNGRQLVEAQHGPESVGRRCRQRLAELGFL